MPQQKEPAPEISAAEDFGVSTGARVATLVDGVFAIVMTLLVLIRPAPHRKETR